MALNRCSDNFFTLAPCEEYLLWGFLHQEYDLPDYLLDYCAEDSS
ncbi:hypothetical protein C5167_031511 [Papaver somniferum]|uniref:Uncharacterized protein n=1 Tax=Papaver somniferum TaxID=3469 RepID=A0A4Y7K5Z8_PAPSO|nr:hypothetical protein C5167_031511 [Papaver somniferum]